MLRKTEGITSILECGCNIGRNIMLLDMILSKASKSIIEINNQAFNYVSKNYNINLSYNGSIIESNFNNDSFDLTFTCGVLIHIHPDELLINMKKLYDYSKKYILIAEYFNRTPVMIEYQGHKNKLFKRDFGKFFIDNYNVKLVDYGFLWGYLYDSAGFDDVTWWVFEKK